MKVGRAALDEDAIRLIEAHNPEIEFDWTRILKGQADEADVEQRRPPRTQTPRPERQDRRQPPQQAPAAGAAPPVDRASQPEAPPAIEDEAAGPGDAVLAMPVDDGPLTAAHAKLGSEGVSRLRGRYAEMRARIAERIQDPERQAELKTLAERLNPDAWVTHADVLAGLDTYESSFEALRSVVGHRRKRSRRRNEPGGNEPARPGPAGTEPPGAAQTGNESTE